MLFNLVYDVVLILLAAVYAPRIIFQWVFHKKYRNSLPERFGLQFPCLEKKNRKLVWIHAVSLGETRAVSSIVKRIKINNPDAMIITSSVTETGFAEAKRSMPEADEHVFLPLDFMWIIKPIINRIRPDIVILCESDFWFNFLKCCKEKGALIYLVNGKLSERSLKLYNRFSWFSRHLFSKIDHFLVQSEHYRERFLKLGVNDAQIVVTGNIKFDASYPALTEDALSEWREKLGMQEKDFVLVAGSTHNPEESIILEALESVWRQVPEVSLILVPRHPERFQEVAALLEKKGIPFNRFSQINQKSKKAKIVLIDAMGLLRQCYQLADVAIVAGSYTPKVGGHNIIEPSGYGVPVIYGPHMHTQPELVELMQRYRAGVQVPPEQLEKAISSLLDSKSERALLGDAGRQMIEDLQGAADKTYQIIFEQKKACKK